MTLGGPYSILIGEIVISDLGDLILFYFFGVDVSLLFLGESYFIDFSNTLLLASELSN